MGNLHCASSAQHEQGEGEQGNLGHRTGNLNEETLQRVVKISRDGWFFFDQLIPIVM
jgi:hypothetical protein